MSWPEFPNPQPLTGTRTWTAAFDSYDQRNEDLYYLVRIFDGEHCTGEFMAKIDATYAGPDEVRQRIAEVAADGKANTEYTGYWRKA